MSKLDVCLAAFHKLNCSPGGSGSHAFVHFVYQEIALNLPQWYRQATILRIFVSNLLTITSSRLSKAKNDHEEHAVLLCASMHWWTMVLCFNVVMPSSGRIISEYNRVLINELRGFCGHLSVLSFMMGGEVNSAFRSPLLFMVTTFCSLLSSIFEDGKVSISMADCAVLATAVKIVCDAMPDSVVLVDYNGQSPINIAASTSFCCSGSSVHGYNIPDELPVDMLSEASAMAHFGSSMTRDNPSVFSPRAQREKSSLINGQVYGLAIFWMIKTMYEHSPEALFLADRRGNLPVHTAALSGNSEALLWMVHQNPKTLLNVNKDGYNVIQLALGVPSAVWSSASSDFKSAIETQAPSDSLHLSSAGLSPGGSESRRVRMSAIGGPRHSGHTIAMLIQLSIDLAKSV